MDSLLAGSYVDASHVTVNNAGGDQLITNTTVNTTVNREFIIFLPVYPVSNPSM